MTSDEYLLSLCLQEAWAHQTLALPNPTVGAMVMGESGQILSLSVHTQSGYPHAEIKALKEAYEFLSGEVCPADTPECIHHFLSQYHNGLFKKCSIFVTLEPCNHYGKTPPCADLLVTLNPRRVVIGAKEKQKYALGGIDRLQKAGVEVVYGVLEEACNELLYPFDCLKENKHFNLFKVTQRLNGDYRSGAISGEESRVFTHNQRCVANALVISGKTVRQDRPILDVRYACEFYGKRPPDIKILSRTNNFDSNIRLFSLKDRRVKICSNPDELGIQNGFNVIEGGWGLFETLKNYIDMFLLHISPTLEVEIMNTGFQWRGKLLHIHKFGNDGLLWIKNF